MMIEQEKTLAVHPDPALCSQEENNTDAVDSLWAIFERLPTYTRVRTSVLYERKDGEETGHKRLVDVTKLEPLERRLFIDDLIQNVEVDNLRLLKKQRERLDRLGLKLPTVEIKYQNLCVEAECSVHRGIETPSLWNTVKSLYNDLGAFLMCISSSNKEMILKDVSGIIKPSRLTLLLGPPGCGKTTFLQALAARLDSSLKVTGNITYNGFNLDEFVPQKTSAYVSQHDLHIPEISVRETLDFAARCQGTRSRADIMMEVIRREKAGGLQPEHAVDTYMKATAVEGLKKYLQSDYILKILGLDICADNIVGSVMKRGISGGEKKRLTTGELIIGPVKALLMDEISNGLDSSTTSQIITCLQQLAHITDFTIVVSLRQPAPETFDLFDDIILMAEGRVIYHGPKENILEFFKLSGFSCPSRKGTADFLQEVVSRKDQAQYWDHPDQPFTYLSAECFADRFKAFSSGQKLVAELSKTVNKSEFHEKALSQNIYSLGKWELLKTCMSREWLLMKRNYSVHVSKSAQLVVVGTIAMTVFVRIRMRTDEVTANYYMGSLFFALIRLASVAVAELALTGSRLNVFYKQRDLYFYPAWAYAIPAVVLRIPFSILDALLWTSLTYYVIGYSPEPERFFKQFLLLSILHQASLSWFRFIASLIRHPSVAASCGLFSLLFMFLFGGFIIRKPSLPLWLRWGFWLSPLSYAELGTSITEFYSPRWQQKVSSSNITLGTSILHKSGLDFNDYFYWICIAGLVGFWLVFNIGFCCALTLAKSSGRSNIVVGYKNHRKHYENTSNYVNVQKSKGMALPFEPATISFENVQYNVETLGQKRQLLKNITGAFRPGVLTALMGVTGAGKTTLMDVLSGRKTNGIIEGEIKINGHSKVQKSYSRISAYCEQTDIHSPLLTIEESVKYSAWLRLPFHFDQKRKSDFVAEVITMIELDEIKDALVGSAGTDGISNEQRKRLTIAVELVSNPSIIFMDEPTSGLDARAAAIVMRAVKNIVSTKRTVVCTIHQPSIDIFDAFDELLLMKRGGQVIYFGELGQYGSKVVEYFEDISGVSKIKQGCNPATWILNVTSPSMEAKLGVDFAQLYDKSQLRRKNEDLVKAINSIPPQSSDKVLFSNGWAQFKSCLWKHNLSYWRSPKYNLVRLVYITCSSMMIGALLWNKGQTLHNEQDLLNIIGTMYIFIQFFGIGNCSAVVPFVDAERMVVYRERFSGMYSSWAYSTAQVIVELPYVFLQTALFMAVTYPSINLHWSAFKMFWYFYTMFCSLLSFTYLGMLFVSLTPNYQVAALYASFCYTLTNLFSGFLIPEPDIPKWWTWLYWICPTSWSLRGMVTSQYGDVMSQVLVFGQPRTISNFLQDYYGYNRDDLGFTAVVLLAYPLIFAFLFSVCIEKLNFQKR